MALSEMEARRLYGMLPVGSANAISRAGLCRLWQTNDRMARLLVSELRKMDFGDEYIIVSYSNGKGYYRTDDLGEIQAFAAEMRSRALNIFAPLKKANRIINACAAPTLQFERF